MTLTFATTNIRTGSVTCDRLPLRCSSISDRLAEHGELKGELAIDENIRHYLSGIQPWRSVLWAFDDGVPFWAGIIQDIDPASIVGGKLGISANTVGTLFMKRTLDVDKTYTDVFSYTIATELISYALSKTGGAASFFTDPPVISRGPSPRSTVTYAGADHTTIWELVTTLADSAGFDFFFRINPDARDLGVTLTLGDFFEDAKLQCRHPGNIKDYEFATLGWPSATRVIVTGGETAAGVKLESSAVDNLALDANWPLLEEVVSNTTQGATSQATLDLLAANELESRKQSILLPTVTVFCDQVLNARTINVGDIVDVEISSDLHPTIVTAGTTRPGFSATQRVVAIDYHVINNDVESVTLGLGDLL